jgi:enoyl-CoA hydratase
VDSVTTSRAGAVAIVRVDHPPANAMNVELLDEIVAALQALSVDPPRALVVAGRDGFFSGGADLKLVPGYGPVDGINEMALTTYGLPYPVVTAVTGHAIAGGLVLAVCADYRVASIAGRYGLTEVKVGVPYPKAAIGVVRAELAPHAARRLALGNRLTDAAECVTLGVFDEAVAPDRVLDRALEVARELAAFPADVYARTKLELRGSAIDEIRTAVASDPLLDAWVAADEQDPIRRRQLDTSP